MLHLQTVQITQGTVSVGAALPLSPPGMDSLFLSGWLEEQSEHHTPESGSSYSDRGPLCLQRRQQGATSGFLAF